jgi:hypothetical protein
MAEKQEGWTRKTFAASLREQAEFACARPDRSEEQKLTMIAAAELGIIVTELHFDLRELGESSESALADVGMAIVSALGTYAAAVSGKDSITTIVPALIEAIRVSAMPILQGAVEAEARPDA